jgi:FtsH-binding integral membrane protein
MKILTFLLIHVITPIIGLLGFLFLKKKILKESIENPPLIDLFFIFSIYGGILLIILTELFWKWSGMASLGAFFLTIPGFVIMAIIGYRNYKFRHVSIYHKISYLCGLAYCIIMPLTILTANIFLDK